MEIKITHFNMQLSCSSFQASRFQQTAKHLKRCSPSLKNLHLEEKTGAGQILKGVLVITVGPCYFKQLALGIQEKQASSLIIVVTTWKQKKNCINRKFPSVCRVYRILSTKKKKNKIKKGTCPPVLQTSDYWNSYDTWGFISSDTYIQN